MTKFSGVTSPSVVEWFTIVAAGAALQFIFQFTIPVSIVKVLFLVNFLHPRPPTNPPSATRVLQASHVAVLLMFIYQRETIENTIIRIK